MDDSLFRWINGLAIHLAWANSIVRFYAENGIVLFGLLIVGVLLSGRQRGDARIVAGAVWAGAAALLALAVGQLIGSAVDRARPYATLVHVHVLVSRTTDVSFPSDHATVAGAVAVGLLVVERRWGIVAAVAAIVMAVVRVWAGAHYPGDVLGGLVLGGLTALAGSWLVLPLLTRLVERLRSTPLRVAVGGAPTRASD